MSLLHFRRIERRRTARATMCMNLLVYGEIAEVAKFRYWTKSISVSAYGGVLVLETPLNIGQEFHVINEYNNKKARAKIVALRTREGEIHGSFEFVECAEKFWSMTFPPAGAKALRRCAPKAV